MRAVLFWDVILCCMGVTDVSETPTLTLQIKVPTFLRNSCHAVAQLVEALR